MLGCPSRARLTRRVERGVALARAGAAPLLVLSGGGNSPAPEATLMRDFALVRGVPPTGLLLEPNSRDTVENARETARLLAARGLRSVILVSDRTHLPRATLLFRLAGIRVAACSGIPAPSLLREASAAAREAAALPWSLCRALLRRN